MTIAELGRGLNLLGLVPRDLIPYVEGTAAWEDRLDLLDRARRQSAAKFHPDRGGNEEDMQCANAACDWLKGASKEQLLRLLGLQVMQPEAARQAAEAFRAMGETFRTVNVGLGEVRSTIMRAFKGASGQFEQAFQAMREGKRTVVRMDLGSGAVTTETSGETKRAPATRRYKLVKD